MRGGEENQDVVAFESSLGAQRLYVPLSRLPSRVSCPPRASHPLQKPIILVFLRFLIFAKTAILIFANGKTMDKRRRTKGDLHTKGK